MCPRSNDVGAQDAAREDETSLDALVGAFEIAVLVLDDDVAVVPRPIERREHRAPVDLAEARQSRDLPADPLREDAALVEALAIDHQVLGLHVQDVRAELADETRDVDHLEDQVRRVEVEPDAAAPGLENAAPHARRRGEVVAARPLVVAEQHRAVLEGQLPAVVVGEADDVGPDAQRLLPVVVRVLRAVRAHERVDERDVHRLRGGDDVAEVTDDLLAVHRIRVERVGVVAEAGNVQAPGPDASRQLGGLTRALVGDVDVAGPGISPARAGRPRPAGDLDALEAVAGGPVDDLVEWGIGEGSGQQAQPHQTTSPVVAPTGTASRTTSTQRPRRALSAIASLMSITA